MPQASKVLSADSALVDPADDTETAEAVRIVEAESKSVKTGKTVALDWPPDRW